MPATADRIRFSVRIELDAAAWDEARGDFHSAFRHLERAHVLGQSSTVEHVRVHWHMFRFGLRNQVRGEAIGQVWRIFAAAVFTPVGLVPEGNTGGANVRCTRRMPVPRDLRQVLDGSRLA